MLPLTYANAYSLSVSSRHTHGGALHSRCLLVQPTTLRSAITAAAADNTRIANGNGQIAGETASHDVSSQRLTASSTGNDAPQNGVHDFVQAVPAALALPAEKEPSTIFARIKRFFTVSALDKARLAALGFGAFSAYGVLSNINAGILITIAWLTVVRTTGLTPLDGGNWPRFIAIYAGLYIGSNFLRPVRLTLALAAAPLFDAAICAISRRTGLPRIPAFIAMLLLIAVGTTSTLLATIAALGGFPPNCRMPWQPLGALPA